MNEFEGRGSMNEFEGGGGGAWKNLRGGVGEAWMNLRGGGRRAYEFERRRRSMEQFDRRRRGMLTTGNGATQSATCCTMCKGLQTSVGIGHVRFENSGSDLNRHPGLFSLDCRQCRGYTGGRRSPKL